MGHALIVLSWTVSKANKAAAQKQWVSKKKSWDYFKGVVHVRRVQEWQKQNPACRHRCKNGLQDHIVSTARNLQQLGQDIRNSSIYIYQGGDHGHKNSDKPRPNP